MIYEDILLRILQAKVLESMSRSSNHQDVQQRDEYSISALNKSNGVRCVRPDDFRKSTEDFCNMYMYFARDITKIRTFHRLPILQ